MKAPPTLVTAVGAEWWRFEVSRARFTSHLAANRASTRFVYFLDGLLPSKAFFSYIALRNLLIFILSLSCSV
jgi:hypothetical protein